MERVCENTVSVEFKQTKLNNFVPFIRSGEWSDIGGRDYMEDAHVCISDLAKNFGYSSVDDEVISFYGVITCSFLNIFNKETIWLLVLLKRSTSVANFTALLMLECAYSIVKKSVPFKKLGVSVLLTSFSSTG